eukprot:3529565-Rhodomonas_salina.1
MPKSKTNPHLFSTICARNAGNRIRFRTFESVARTYRAMEDRPVLMPGICYECTMPGTTIRCYEATMSSTSAGYTAIGRPSVLS